MYNNYQSPQNNFIRGVNTNLPQPMPAGMSEDALYPYEALPSPSQGTPGYAKGGMVETNNNLPSLAELIRQQGTEEDSILAHINPLEAMILKNMGGSGDINPRTGLPQFSLFSNPLKALKSSIGSGAGAVLGNMVLPGIGGVIGGGLGQGLQNVTRGKSFGEGALKGAAIGAMLPTGASLLGSGLNSMGATGAGNYLSNYGANNSVLASLGLGGQAAGVAAGDSYTLGGSAAGLGGNNVFATNPGALSVGALGESGAGLSSLGGLGNTAQAAAPTSFLEKLWSNTSNLASNPLTLMAAIGAASSLANRPKAESPEGKAKKEKRYEKEKRWTKEELAELENYLLSQRQMERRIARNQYLPEERFDVQNRYKKVSTPEEFRNTGSWMSYYDNPQFRGEPLRLKKGGLVPMLTISEMIIDTPGKFFNGNTKGQDDKVKLPNADVSDGEVVIPADVVAHLGDGNSNAGWKEIKENLIDRVRADKSKPMRNGLPPKAKSLSQYLSRS